MTLGSRRIGKRSSNSVPARNASAQHLNTQAAQTELRRFEQHEGIKPRPEQIGLTDTERLVHSILDGEFVSAKELAGFAGISVHECRRALATLRSLGLADAQRRGQVNAWRRA